jgi:phenylalanyl-tRNA synthetase alpha subunit
MERIDYNILNDSLYYYESNGYKYVEVPWMIDDKVSDITKPEDRENFYINDNQVLVASGEQSFMQLINDAKIEPGKYVALTPCFRDEPSVDKLHKQYFMKTELIVLDTMPNLKKEFINVLRLCCEFFKKYTSVVIQHNETVTSFDSTDFKKIEEFIISRESSDNPEIEDIYDFDIIDKNSSIELGSYGIRSETINNKIASWIYATACAEPRLSSTIRESKLPGYHDALIPKNSIGTFEKILEEFEELKDAKMSKNKIMELVEISDLIGAIELYVKKEYNISMDDLNVMNKITQRAFLNGRR